MGLIYKLTTPSGKIYIGQTTRTLEQRYKEHFTSKKYSDKEKYNMALEYLNSYKDEGSTTK